MRSGPSAATKRATSGSTMPAPAAIVSCACWLGVSSFADGRRDAALRPARRSALAERRGGQDGDRQRRQLQRGEQARKARADDDDVAVCAQALFASRGGSGVARSS